MKYTTAIFDMDGVIIDSEKIWRTATQDFLELRGLIFDQEKLEPRMRGKSGLDAIKILKEYYHLDGSPEELNAERASLVEIGYTTSLQFVDGFLDFYKQIVDMGFKKCIATASDPGVLSIVDQLLNLSAMFGENIFKVADVDYKSKPDPALFLHAAEKMGSRHQECFVIEDSPNGIDAAKNAKMYAIALTTSTPRKHLQHANLIVDSFAEIDLGKL